QRRYSPDGTRRLQFGAGASPGVVSVSRTTGAADGLVIDTGGTVDSAAFSPDGSRVWTFAGAQVRAWSAKTGQSAGPTFTITPEPFQTWISDNASRLCLLDQAHQTLEIWDLEQGR